MTGRLVSGGALCAVLACLAGCAGTGPARAPAVTEVDRAAIEGALAGYRPFPPADSRALAVGPVLVESLDRAGFEVRNNLSRHEVEVEAVLSVDGRAAAGSVKRIGPGETAAFRVGLPVTLSGVHRIAVEAGARAPEGLPPWESGLVFRARSEKEFDFESLARVPRAPRGGPGPGDVSPWPGKALIVRESRDDIIPENAREKWDGPDDLGARFGFAWDGEYFRLAVAVRDDRHWNTRDGAEIWNGDCLQVAFAPGREAAGHLNIGFALAHGGETFHQWRGPETGLKEHTRYAIRRDEEAGTTLYLARLPLDRLGIEARKGVVFGFSSLVFDDDDGRGQDYRVETSPGLAGGWNPSLFRRFVLWD